jgi:pimeloyl-ACP methyl ester carboxylesterase
MTGIQSDGRQTGFANVLGTRLYYETAGAGAPLILLHAGIASSRMWDAQFAELAQHFRVVRYDLRGYGQSAVVEGKYAHWQDLYELMDHLRIEQAHLLGASNGGRVALDFALQHPRMTGALVLASARAGGTQHPDWPPQDVDAVDDAVTAGDFVLASEIEVRMWVDGPNRPPGSVDAGIRDAVRDMNIVALKYEATGQGEEVPLDPPAVDRLNEVVAPTLVIYGDQDYAAIQDGGDLLAERIGAARKQVIKGAAHLPNLEKPEEFNRLVIDFLKKYS